MDKYYISLISACIGAVSGLVAAYWRTRYTVKSQDLSKRLEDLCDSIEKLEEIACDYWGLNIEKKPSQHYILGYKTKISLLVTYLDEEYTQFSKDEISESLAEFFRACTGGDFESAKDKQEPERQRRILINGEKLKIELLKTRNKLY